MNTLPQPGIPCRDNDPAWIKAAFGDLGLHERPGPTAHPRVVEMYAKAGHPEIRDDAVAWCSAAANTWMVESDHAGTGSLAARSWLAWGNPLDTTKRLPRGAVLIFRRGGSSWQGHVCFLLEDGGPRLTVIGGNQSDAVTVTTMPRRALIGARWPNTAANSRTVMSFMGGGVGAAASEVAGQAADALGGDGVTEWLGTAKETIEPYAYAFALAKWALLALTLAVLAWGAWHFIQSRLRPRAMPEIAAGFSIDDERPRSKRRPRGRKAR